LDIDGGPADLSSGEKSLTAAANILIGCSLTTSGLRFKSGIAHVATCLLSQRFRLMLRRLPAIDRPT
jgi:hypothetical protein